ncbi:MAG: TRAP transporter large permease subunit [Candidatus Marinimicrobia bacterium]|nr:TRAP transporter large permease subunit [Candidatus Neomarinimicrobiota bacterium]
MTGSTASLFIQNKFKHSENLISVVVLAAMALLPVAEVFAREILSTSITGSIVTVQHLTLWIGLAGAMLATRDGRLLTLTGETAWLRNRFGQWIFLLPDIAAVGVTLTLAIASYDLMITERAFPRVIVGPVKVWMAQLIMPLGFGIVALRLFLKSNSRWAYRLAVTGGIIILTYLGLSLELQEGWAVYAGLIALVASAVLGAPIYVILGGVAILLFWNDWGVMAAIPAETYRIVVHPMLPTIPLFTLAGYFMAESNASTRLVRLFRAWFGWVPGGTPVVAIVVCAFFTSFTGGSGVTILALGGLMFPMLLKENYSPKFSTGLLTASGSLGLLFPPSLPVILYGIRSQTPIDKLFLAGILPGFVLILLVALWAVRQGLVLKSEPAPFRIREAWESFWAAKWEVAIPALILFGIFGGVTTLVEAAAVTVVYTFIVEVFVYKDLKLSKDVIPTMVQAATLVGGVLIIMGVAMGLTSYLVDAQVPSRALHWVQSHIDSKLVFLLALNGALLIVGALMDIFSAIIVVVPLIAPMGLAFGVDPVHLGIIFLVNLELGYLTPPVGMNLFLSSYRFSLPLPKVYSSVVPYLIILAFGVLLITYIPSITLLIPRLLGH